MTPLLLLAEIRTFAIISPFLTVHFNLPFLCLLLNQFLLSSTFKLKEIDSSTKLANPGGNGKYTLEKGKNPKGANPDTRVLLQNVVRHK